LGIDRKSAKADLHAVRNDSIGSLSDADPQEIVEADEPDGLVVLDDEQDVQRTSRRQRIPAFFYIEQSGYIV